MGSVFISPLTSTFSGCSPLYVHGFAVHHLRICASELLSEYCLNRHWKLMSTKSSPYRGQTLTVHPSGSLHCTALRSGHVCTLIDHLSPSESVHRLHSSLLAGLTYLSASHSSNLTTSHQSTSHSLTHPLREEDLRSFRPLP